MAHGAAGLAYVELRRATLAGDRAALGSAARWTAAAERALSRPGAFDGDPAAGFPTPAHGPPWSLYFGEAGVWCVSALVASAGGDREAAARALRRFASVASACPPTALDAVQGEAGLLLGAAALVESVDGTAREAVGALGTTLEAGVATAAARARGPDERYWLGAAHGLCGVAHALLRWAQATGGPPHVALLPLLDALRAARLPSGAWPRHQGSTVVWPGWCHGAAGWAQLWTLAAEVLGDPELLALAEQACSIAVTPVDGLPDGACCGRVGMAFAALAVHRATEEGRWLEHARRLADEVGDTAVGPAFPARSLWRGDLGRELLLLELDHPDRAAMPLYRR